jgi:hypothetical protein
MFFYFRAILINMAKTSYIDLAPELSDKYFSGLQPGDRFTSSRITRKNSLMSQKTKKGVSQRSLLTDISAAWWDDAFGVQDDWNNAAEYCNLTGWRLFVQDYCARRVNGLSDLALPSNYHQSWVGQIHIESPATECKLIQSHPRNYYVMRKVTGTKSMYNPVLVTEDFNLPHAIAISYSSDLTPCGPNPFAKYYAEIWYTYQGRDLSYILEIPFDFVSDWTSASNEIDFLRSYVVGYNLFIHINDLQGDLYFDNVRSYHSGQNWVRDPFCKDINQGFSRNYYQVSKHWAAVIAPEGVLFESVYKDFPN